MSIVPFVTARKTRVQAMQFVGKRVSRKLLIDSSNVPYLEDSCGKGLGGRPGLKIE